MKYLAFIVSHFLAFFPFALKFISFLYSGHKESFLSSRRNGYSSEPGEIHKGKVSFQALPFSLVICLVIGEGRDVEFIANVFSSVTCEIIFKQRCLLLNEFTLSNGNINNFYMPVICFLEIEEFLKQPGEGVQLEGHPLRENKGQHCALSVKSGCLLLFDIVYSDNTEKTTVKLSPIAVVVCAKQISVY